MKTIQLHKQNKNMIKNIDASMSYDEIINSLLDDVENDLPVFDVDYSTKSSIKLNDDTIERLSAYKLTDGESFENIIVRIILTKGLNKIKS